MVKFAISGSHKDPEDEPSMVLPVWYPRDI